jgi:hypothetical protein
MHLRLCSNGADVLFIPHSSLRLCFSTQAVYFIQGWISLRRFAFCAEGFIQIHPSWGSAT